ncbi:hypothetical protein LPJ61_000085 [Coemansia biformis]|uniref:TOG domain-containing protein n=1 Tax=Coemansia biformis TaxID=1286918 RepID=A0A9W7YJG4_9FUNG|nr:hypothetical protein LPJ61_000085 [Coemansia biformis]
MADEEDHSALPLEQRLVHKIWKVRAGAYNDLAAELRRLDPDVDMATFSNYESYLGKMIVDANMAAQEAAMSAAIAYVQYAPSPVRRREELVAGVVAKGLSSTKAGTRASSVELLLMLSEVDTPGPVVAGVLEGFDAKQPKAVAAAVTAIRDIVHAFGIGSVGLKPLLKALAKPFAHRDNSVRAEAQQLAVELYRWVGQAIVPSLHDLPPVLLKDLESQFAAVAGDPPPKQTRLLRSQQLQQQQQQGEEEVRTGPGAGSGAVGAQDDDGGGDAAGPAPGIDPWDLADPVDIAAKLPDDFHTLIVSSKWKERKEAAEQLHDALKKTVRLKMSASTGDAIHELGKKVGDININVATLVIQCLGRFASGLRGAFGPYVQSTLPALVERSKERKQTVIDAIRTTTDAYFAAIECDLPAIGDHYFTGAMHKNPQTRAEAHHFLRRCFAAVPTRPARSALQRYADQLKAGLDDGDAGVRDAAAECLGTLSKLALERDAAALLEGIDKIKMDKVNEYAGQATVCARAAPKPAPAKPAPPRPAGARPAQRAQAPGRAPAAATNGAAAAAGLGANMPPHLRKKLEASAQTVALKKAQREGRVPEAPPPAAPAPSPKRAAPAPPPKRAPPRKTTPAAAPAAAARGKADASARETVRMRYSGDDDIDTAVADALPAAVLAGAASAQWKDRVEAMDQLLAFLQDEAARGAGVHSELVVRQLARRPGWRESNFQVTARAFQIIAWMAGDDAVEFTAGAAALCVPALVDRLGDIKLKTPASDALVAIAERFSLRMIVNMALEPIGAQKSPKVVADCLAWLDTQLVDFGIAGLPLRPMVGMVRTAGLLSNNAQTRARAVALVGTLRRAVGPGVMDLLSDLNPQLVQLLEAEFDRIGSQPLPEPTHTQGSLGAVGGAAAASAGGDSSGGAAAASDDPMDELVPRQDLNALVGPAIYRKLGDANWKERKAALEAIQAALEGARHRVQPAISGDLYTALKQRLQDPNKNLIAVALMVLAMLSAASGSAQVPNIRIVALATMHCLADKKPQLRTAALAALTAWADANAATIDQAILPAVPTALGDTSPELRASLLAWIADTLGARQRTGLRLPDLSALVTPLFACLQDRSADVRKHATRVLALTVASCGFEAVHDACALQLRGAARDTVAPAIEELRNTLGTSAGSSAAGGAADMGPLRRASAVPARARPGASDRAPSPAAEPVMTASELLGRSGSSARPGVARAAPSGASGPGMLRRPLAVRRPVSARPGAAPAGSSDGSRPASSLRGAPPAQSMAAQLARMSPEELERLPPLLDHDPRAKEQRARRDMAAAPQGMTRWAQLGDAAVRGELEQQLREQAAAHFNPLLMRQLFATGHHRDRECLAGLTALEEVVSIPSLAQQRFGLPLMADADEDSLAARLAAHLDLLLKYISIRMYEGSTHTLLKSLDLLERLVGLVEAPWSDYEAQAVVPALVARLGDAKEAVRARARRLLTQLVTHLYPATKLFTMLLELGVVNRANARVRQEALDCICFLVRERTAGLGLGAVCAQPARAVPVIAQSVGDRDSNVRSAALAVLVAVGEQLPGGAAELWRLCGRMPERERSMLEERLKRSSLATAAPAAPERPASRSTVLPAIRARLAQHSAAAGAAPGIGLRPASGLGRAVAAPVSRLSRPLPPATAGEAVGGMPRLGVAAGGARPMFSLDFDNLSLPSYSSATAEQLGAGRGQTPAAAASPGPPLVEPSERASHYAIGYGAGRSGRMQSALPGGGDIGSYQADPAMPAGDSEREWLVAAAVADLRREEPRAAESAIERLQAALDTSGPALTHMRRSVGDICTAVTGPLRWAYSTTDTSPLEALRARMRKATVGLLIGIFSDARLAPWVPQVAVQVVLDELMQRLADPLLCANQWSPDHSHDGIPNGDQLVKAVNSLMLKILDRADRTAVYVSLIRILDAGNRDPVPATPQTDDQIVRSTVVDVVMKCLWRISKYLTEEVQAQFGPHLASGAPVPEHVASPAIGDSALSHAIHVDAVLRVSEQFFVHIPGSVWRRCADRQHWMFGDLPRRTVKTISHSLAVVLRGHIWQFAGPLVGEAMRQRPGMLALPYVAQQQEPQLAAWADDAHAKMARASETWEYLCRALQSVGEPQDRPTPSQMLALVRSAVDPAPVERSPLLGGSPRLSYLHTLPAAERARSPVSGTPSRLFQAGSPAHATSAAPCTTTSSAASHADRLKALRERIGASQQPAAALPAISSAPRSPVPTAPATASMSPPPSASAAADTLQHPAPSRPANMDEIRQRIALMRSSLRSQK